MNAPPRERLYSPELLALATSLADYPLGDDLALRGEARSRTCGSSVLLGLGPGHDGAIARIGMRVSACAVGQASAAIFAREAAGRSASDILHALATIDAWLGGQGGLPDWPGMAALAAARAFPSRHGAIVLPWKAALDALSKAGTAG